MAAAPCGGPLVVCAQLIWRGRLTATTGDCAALQGVRRLDGQMPGQLGRAVGLSEDAALQMIGRVTGLRALSTKLMGYLQTAHVQSDTMQVEIERSGRIVAELANFVQKMP